MAPALATCVSTARLDIGRIIKFDFQRNVNKSVKTEFY